MKAPIRVCLKEEEEASAGDDDVSVWQMKHQTDSQFPQKKEEKKKENLKDSLLSLFSRSMESLHANHQRSGS